MGDPRSRAATWVIHGLLRPAESASPIPAGTVAASLAASALVYAFLSVVFVLFARRIIARGPDLPHAKTGGSFGASGKGGR